MAFQNTGSGFTNLNKIIDANQNNQLGTTIQNGIQGQATQNKNDVNAATSDFNTQANNANLDTDANKQYIANTLGIFNQGNNSTAGTSQNAGNGTDQASGVSSTPTPYGTDDGSNSSNGSFAGASTTSPGASSTSTQPFQGVTAGQVGAFDTFRQGGYSGPTQLNNYDTLQAQAQNVQAQGNNTGTSGGRQALLQQYAGGNNYTQGEQGLDNIILGQTGAANLQAAKRSTQGLSNDVTQAGTNATNMANTIAAGNKDFGNYTNNQVANVYNPISGQLDTNVANTQTAENTREANIQSVLTTLGIDPNSFTGQQQLSALLAGTAGTTPTALDKNASDYSSQLAGNTLTEGQSAIDQLTKLGLVSNTDTGSGNSNVNPTAGLQQQYSGTMALDRFLDPTTGQYVTQKSDGRYTYDGGAQNGQEYHPPGWDPGSESTQWTNLLANLNKFNATAPQSVNYNQDIGQSITDQQAQNLNRAGLTNADQAARLNALDQLAGRTQEFNTGTNADGTSNIGNYVAGSDGFNQAQALNAIQAITNPGAAAITSGGDPSASPDATFATVGKDATNGDIRGTYSNMVGSVLGGEAGSLINGLTPGGNSVGNGLTTVGNDVSKTINSITGGGGGGSKIICNELHRQGFISSDVINLDEAYGKAFRLASPDTYKGYLLCARPIVRLMKDSPLITVFISCLAIPWSNYMAHKMDSSRPNSILGAFIHNICCPLLLGIYKVNKICKRPRLSIIKN